MLCQGPLQRRSVTCSRAALGHNRYFCLSSATFSKHAVCTTPQPSACRLASALQDASKDCSAAPKKGRGIGALLA